MLRSWWAALDSMLETGMKQRVTRAGLLYTAAIMGIALAAFVSANNLLFLLFAMMLATLLISGFVSRLTLAGLQVEFSLPEHIAARRKTAAKVVVHNRKRSMTSFSIQLMGVPPSVLESRLYFPAIPPKSHVQEILAVEFGRRGAYHENGFEFSTSFPFGFTERRIKVTLRQDILVYPSLEPQPGFSELLAAMNGDIESRQRGRGSDFYRIRPYEPLESARHVDWRATAHTGELQVREFAQEQDPLVEIFLDLVAPPSQETWFERAVECCAFLVWHASQRECRIRFRTQDVDLMTPTEADVYTILKYLALVSPKKSGDIPEPGHEDSFQLAFTSRSRPAEQEGWDAGQVVSPADLEMDPASEPPAKSAGQAAR